MNDQEITAVATTLGLLLDEIAQRESGGDQLLRDALEGIADLLAERGGLALMGHVFDRVIEQKPAAESWRKGVLDAAFGGFGGWGS